MGTGFVWLDRSEYDNERIGREEGGTISGGAEMGSYTVILRHTPDHEDSITSTDSEVHCLLVDRWVGQGGKSSLVNTVDTDILEYILSRLVVRITTKTRTFLVKVKKHRGEPLNEGTDDLKKWDTLWKGKGKITHGKNEKHD